MQCDACNRTRAPGQTCPISFAAASSLSCDREASTTFRPFFAKWMAIALPTPSEPDTRSRQPRCMRSVHYTACGYVSLRFSYSARDAAGVAMPCRATMAVACWTLQKQPSNTAARDLVKHTCVWILQRCMQLLLQKINSRRQQCSVFCKVNGCATKVIRKSLIASPFYSMGWFMTRWQSAVLGTVHTQLQIKVAAVH